MRGGWKGPIRVKGESVLRRIGSVGIAKGTEEDEA